MLTGIISMKRKIRSRASANSMSGLELEPVSKPAGQLGDWFYMHGFESYAPPPEFTASPAVGLRVFSLDGKPVAQVAMDDHNSLLYIFRAADFRGVEIYQRDSFSAFQLAITQFVQMFIPARE